MSAGDSPVSVPVLPVGMGFFIKPSAGGVTNTFAGAVAINVGTTNSLSLPSAGVNYLVGCAVPYAGTVTNGTDSGGGPNLKGSTVGDLTEILIWNPNTSSYGFVKTDAGVASGFSDAGDSEVSAPSITVGQGFFMKPANASTVWKTGLQ